MCIYSALTRLLKYLLSMQDEYLPPRIYANLLSPCICNLTPIQSTPFLMLNYLIRIIIYYILSIFYLQLSFICTYLFSFISILSSASNPYRLFSSTPPFIHYLWFFDHANFIYCLFLFDGYYLIFINLPILSFCADFSLILGAHKYLPVLLCLADLYAREA